MTETRAAELAREVATRCDDRMAWNYDSLECAALTAVRDAFTWFADLLESKDD